MTILFFLLKCAFWQWFFIVLGIIFFLFIIAMLYVVFIIDWFDEAAPKYNAPQKKGLTVPIFKTVPGSLSELRRRYPNASKYFDDKGGTSVSINGFYVTVADWKSGKQVVYDFLDIEFFEKNYKQ